MPTTQQRCFLCDALATLKHHGHAVDVECAACGLYAVPDPTETTMSLDALPPDRRIRVALLVRSLSRRAFVRVRLTDATIARLAAFSWDRTAAQQLQRLLGYVHDSSIARSDVPVPPALWALCWCDPSQLDSIVAYAIRQELLEMRPNSAVRLTDAGVIAFRSYERAHGDWVVRELEMLDPLLAEFQPKTLE